MFFFFIKKITLPDVCILNHIWSLNLPYLFHHLHRMFALKFYIAPRCAVIEFHLLQHDEQEYACSDQLN